MSIINEKSGYWGFTLDGMGGSPIDSNGRVNRCIFIIQYPARTNGVVFDISDGANDWGALMGDETIIPLKNPKIIYQNKDNTVIEFDMTQWYPCNSPCFLVYRSDTAYWSANETADPITYETNHISGHFGFTIEGYGGTVDKYGYVNRMMVTIPFPQQTVDVEFTISNDPSHWGARMPNGDVITLQRPITLFTNRDNAVIVFEMDKSYPSNSPCVLVYRSSDAKINIKPVIETIFVPVNSIEGIPNTIRVGDPIYFTDVIIDPFNASSQNIEWTLVDGYATLTTTTLVATSSGKITLRAIVEGGESEMVDYYQTFVIEVLPAIIEITNQPDSYTEVEYGISNGEISVDATIKSGTLSYQWYSCNDYEMNGSTPVTSGGTSSTLSIRNNTQPGIHYYFCEIKSTGGAVPVRTNVVAVNVIVKVTGISFDAKPQSASMLIPLQLSAHVNPSNADNKAMTWSSNRTSIATVDSTGLLTGLTTGNVRITVTSVDGNYQDTCDINIIPYVQVSNITNIPSRITVGVPYNLEPIVEPYNASVNEVRWSIVSDFNTNTSLVDNVITAGSTGNYDMMILRGSIENGVTAGITYSQDFRIAVEYSYTPVTDVSMTVFETKAMEPLKLSYAIVPYNATNRSIIWTIEEDNDTDSVINQATEELVANNPGTVRVSCRIINGATITTDFVKSFDITISSAQIPVEDITGIPSEVGRSEYVKFNPIIDPTTATYKDIEWSIVDAGSARASITSDGTFYASRTGTAKVLATIANGISEGSTETTEDDSIDFTKEFTINVISFVAVTDIYDVPEKIAPDQIVELSGKISPTTATYKDIEWSIVDAGDTDAEIVDNNKITAYYEGSIIVEAKITNGKSLTGSDADYIQEFTIIVEDPFISVEDIIDVPKNTIVNTPLTLIGTVVPDDATYKDIEWSIVDAGDTDAEIVDNILTSTSGGIVKIIATIPNGVDNTDDYTKEFDIEIFNVESLPDIV